MAITASSWMKMNCGDRVHRYDDERHIGRVEMIKWSHEVVVRWEDNGFTSIELLSDLKVFEKRKAPYLAIVRSLPKTHAVSPRRQLEAFFRGEEKCES